MSDIFQSGADRRLVSLGLAAFAVACGLFRRLMRAIPERDRWYVALVWLCIVAFGADWSVW